MGALLKVNEFASKYGVTPSNIYVKKSSFNLTQAFPQGSDGKFYVNEDFFIRREKFKNKVQAKSEEMYFFLSDRLSVTSLARMLHNFDKTTSLENWIMFLGRTLFSSHEPSILSFKVKKLSWKFYRFARWIIAEEVRKNKLLECVA